MATAALQKFELPKLPYEFSALEPFISGQIMEIHYDKHHRAYVTNLNKAVESYAEAESKGDLEGMAAQLQAIKFNGGGHINHSIFWTNLAPQDKGGGKAPEGEFAKAIERDFGSFQNLIELMTAKATAHQGSGWVWLGLNKSKHLEIASCDNQDALQSTKGLTPLLGIDVWEHAYYLQYKNVRPDYIKAIWNVINWKDVAERYAKALNSK